MKRRDFIKVAAIGTIATGLPNIVGAVSNDIGDTVDYKGHTLYWTGWIGTADCERLVGRWWGHYKDGMFVQASYPGYGSIYYMGATHDICSTDKQIIPTLKDFINDKDLAYRLKLEALQRVMAIIDNPKDYL